jgi:hypothetical protein
VVFLDCSANREKTIQANGVKGTIAILAIGEVTVGFHGCALDQEIFPLMNFRFCPLRNIRRLFTSIEHP